MIFDEIDPTNMQMLAQYTLEQAENAGHDCQISEDDSCTTCADLWELGKIVAHLDPKSGQLHAKILNFRD